MATPKYLIVIVQASTPEMIEELVESLARSACDIVNSTDDDNAHIIIEDRMP